ncbi:DNA replication complex GINS protein SLD5 [Verticillium dahliae VDG1]|nr:DNA replication complex GINS protein SLD5 [Verticillium dahliae VDG1]
MKSFIAAFGLVGLAVAGPCNNNCGRQVIGTARKSPSLEDRQALCRAFLTSTTTVTPATATVTAAVIYNRNVHGARAEPPTLTGEKPAYASSCPDLASYWNACQCFDGYVPTTVTVTAATPTETVAGPICTQGLEYAIYTPEFDDPLIERLRVEEETIYTPVIANLIQGVVPDFTGVSPKIGPVYGDWQLPLVAPAYGPDAVLTRQEEERVYRAYTLTVTDTSVPVPFRLLWINYGGPGSLQSYIYDPAGNEIAGPNSEKNSQVISSCSGAGAVVGAWPAWESEQVAA